MGISLSIKNVPETLARALRAKAARNHRSLQGELMALLASAAETSVEVAGQPRAAYAVDIERPATKRARARLAKVEPALTLQQLWTRGKRRGLATPSESARFVREDRDRR